ncbi:glycosyltransferase family 4 protein [Methanobacterium sp. SMA-27]|uniref:glycosyltransferase family 4 protein n=1 Tax=Methanobacterium sp. SMA-27 TaxID=1495336 RepID=UPI0009DE5F00|nr:glycosyltransferase family 4 protein [Methanobacterium sp. SMA-27]
MKIGVITSVYPEFKGDPHGIFVHRLMREISKRGHEVHILAPFSGGKTDYIIDGVIVEKFNYFYPRKFQRLSGRSGMIDNVKEGIFVKFQFLTFILFNAINSCRKLHDMDIIHVQWPIPNGLGALFLKTFYKIPYVNTIFGEEVYLSKRYHTIPILKLLVNKSSKTITISTGSLKACLESGLKKEKLGIMPFGVDTNFFRPINVQKDKEIFQILSIGYFIERKGFEYLIKAVKEVLKEYDNIKLNLVGSGPLESQIKKLIEELELDKYVQITSNISDEELLGIYNSSDLFVLPSIVDSQGNTEGLGVVLLEAMACGLPVIGSNIGGIPDIIQDHNTGLLVPPKDILELSKSIKCVIKDKKFRKKLAINGYKMVKVKFSWEKIAEGYLKIYKRV